jgi:hypothetical protein
VIHEATAWIEQVHPHPVHLIRTLEIVQEFGASEALQLAAVTHDSERGFPDPNPPYDSARHFDVPGYLRFHQRRAAAVTDRWLDDAGAPFALRDQVAALIRVHEEGGWPEADLLQAADSLSFLETMVPLVAGWITSGRTGPERAFAKLQWMHDRIAPELTEARERAVPLLEAGHAHLRTVAAPGGTPHTTHSAPGSGGTPHTTHSASSGGTPGGGPSAPVAGTSGPTSAPGGGTPRGAGE